MTESDDLKSGESEVSMSAAPIIGPGSGLRRFIASNEDRRPGDCEILFSQSAYRRIVEHLASDTSRELGGLLLGSEIVSQDGLRSTVLVTHSLAAKHSKGSPVRLSMTAETWAEFERVTDHFEDQGLELKRVGWYHSHPNLSIFLSGYDLDVCTVFTRPTHLALVVDPVQETGGFFVRGSKGFRCHSPQGFWELCDRQAESVVTWRNLRVVEGPGPTTRIELAANPETEVISIRPRTSEASPVEGTNAADGLPPRLAPQGVPIWLLAVMVVLGPSLVSWAGWSRIERQQLGIARAVDRELEAVAGSSLNQATQIDLIRSDIEGLRARVAGLEEPARSRLNPFERMPDGPDAFAGGLNLGSR